MCKRFSAFLFKSCIVKPRMYQPGFAVYITLGVSPREEHRLKYRHPFCMAALLAVTFGVSSARAEFTELTCLGNIETFDRQIIKAGVSYKLSYSVSGNSAKVGFAGREFDVKAEQGKSWRGVWLQRMDDDLYFSFLPEDGGTVKFEFKPNEWYSGNC